MSLVEWPREGRAGPYRDLPSRSRERSRLGCGGLDTRSLLRRCALLDQRDARVNHGRHRAGVRARRARALRAAACRRPVRRSAGRPRLAVKGAKRRSEPLTASVGLLRARAHTSPEPPTPSHRVVDYARGPNTHHERTGPGATVSGSAAVVSRLVAGAPRTSTTVWSATRAGPTPTTSGPARDHSFRVRCSGFEARRWRSSHLNHRVVSYARGPNTDHEPPATKPQFPCQPQGFRGSSLALLAAQPPCRQVWPCDVATLERSAHPLATSPRECPGLRRRAARPGGPAR